MRDFAKYVLILAFFLQLKTASAQKISFELQTGHTGAVSQLLFSPGDELLFSISKNDNAVFIWETASGKLVKKLWRSGLSPNSIQLDQNLPELLVNSTTVWNFNTSVIVENKTKLNDPVAIPNYNQAKIGDTTFTNSLSIGSDKNTTMSNLMYAYTSKKGKKIKGRLFDQEMMQGYTNILAFNNLLLVTTTGGTLHFVNNKGRKQKSYKFSGSDKKATSIISITQSQSKNLLALGLDNGEIIIFDIQKEEILSGCRGQNNVVERMYYSPDGNTIYTISEKGLYGFNLKQNAVQKLNTKATFEFLSINSIEGDSVLVLKYLKGESEFLARWNMKKNTFLSKEISFKQNYFKYKEEIVQKKDSVDDIGVFCFGNSFTIKKTGKEDVSVLTDHNADICAIKINKTYRYFTTASLDGKLKHWDLETGKPLFTSILLNTNSYIHILPEGYYYGTKYIFNSINCSSGSKLFPYSLIDAQYNRPDLVLKQIPQHDSIFLKAVELTYQKRKNNRAGEIQSNSSGNLILKVKKTDLTGNTLGLEIESAGEHADIEQLFVTVNGVSENIPVPAKGLRKFSYTIELSKGENRIEVFAKDPEGKLSNKVQLVEKGKQKGKPDLYIVCIGSGKFGDVSKNLNYAAKDARDMFSTLSKLQGYKSKKALFYTDEQVTEQIPAQIGSFLSGAKKNDVVLVFYAGHGILDKNLDYYLSTYNVDFNDPQKKGISYLQLETVLKQCPARQKLFFIDACHSGDVEKESMTVAAGSIDASSGISFRSASGQNLSQNELGVLLSKELFASGGNTNGISIIGASMGSQFALESNQWNNGVFTHCLLQGIKNKKADYNHDDKVMLDELQYFVNKNVVALTNGKQQPTTRTENLNNNFRVR